MTAEFFFNEYRMRDGTRRICRVVGDRAEAVRTGGHVQGLTGALCIFRWRVRARMPDLVTMDAACP